MYGGTSITAASRMTTRFPYRDGSSVRAFSASAVITSTTPASGLGPTLAISMPRRRQNRTSRNTRAVSSRNSRSLRCPSRNTMRTEGNLRPTLRSNPAPAERRYTITRRVASSTATPAKVSGDCCRQYRATAAAATERSPWPLRAPEPGGGKLSVTSLGSEALVSVAKPRVAIANVAVATICVRPQTSPAAAPSRPVPSRIRQRIESIFWTVKDRRGLERHHAPQLPGHRSGRGRTAPARRPAARRRRAGRRGGR
jgi:hypothetical protein